MFPETIKVCSGCDQTLPITEFRVNRYTSGVTINKICKSCTNAAKELHKTYHSKESQSISSLLNGWR